MIVLYRLLLILALSVLLCSCDSTGQGESPFAGSGFIRTTINGQASALVNLLGYTDGDGSLTLAGTRCATDDAPPSYALRLDIGSPDQGTYSIEPPHEQNIVRLSEHSDGSGSHYYTPVPLLPAQVNIDFYDSNLRHVIGRFWGTFYRSGGEAMTPSTSNHVWPDTLFVEGGFDIVLSDMSPASTGSAGEDLPTPIRCD